MKITMLGHSNVGKTTFMACMYEALQSDVEGLSVRARDPGDHRRLISLARRVRSGAGYPEKTDTRDEYDLVLLHHGDEALDFTWVDYRGGALMEVFGSYETRQLHQDLLTSDGILAFFDATALERSRWRSREVGRMISLLSKALGEVDKATPVALTVTKADTAKNLSAALKKLAPLRQTISRSNKVHGAVIPTTCAANDISGVHLPTLFCLNVGVASLSDNLRGEITAGTARSRQLRANSGLVNEIYSWLTSQKSNWELANDQDQVVINTELALKELEMPAKALTRHVSRVERF